MMNKIKPQLDVIKKSTEEIKPIIEKMSATIDRFLDIDQSFIQIDRGLDEDEKWIETMFDRVDELFLKRDKMVTDILDYFKVVKTIESAVKNIYFNTQIESSVVEWYNLLIEKLKTVEDEKKEEVVEKIEKEKEDEIQKITEKLTEEEEQVEKKAKGIESKREKLNEELKRIEEEERIIEEEKEILLLKKAQEIENINEQYQGVIAKRSEVFEKNKLEIDAKMRGNRKVDYDRLIVEKHKKQLLLWCNKKLLKLSFDSKGERFVKNRTTDLEKSIVGKKDLYFVIFDVNNNIFGGFIDNTISGLNCPNHSENMFVFTLESNGRIKEPMKYGSVGLEKFVVFDSRNDWLFTFGYSARFPDKSDIVVVREGAKNQSYCGENSFNYSGFEKPLCGDYNFQMRRLMVFEAFDEIVIPTNN